MLTLTFRQTRFVASLPAGVSLSELRDELVTAWTTRTQTQLFRSPVTSFLYERGWRQNFANAG